MAYFCFGPRMRLSKLTLSYIGMLTMLRTYSFWPATLATTFNGLLSLSPAKSRKVELFWFLIKVSMKSDFKLQISLLCKFFTILTLIKQ